MSPTDPPRHPDGSGGGNRGGMMDLPLRPGAGEGVTDPELQRPGRQGAGTDRPARRPTPPKTPPAPRRRGPSRRGRSRRRRGRRVALVGVLLGAAALLAWWQPWRAPAALSASSLAFDDRRVGTEGDPRTVRLSNAGGPTLTVAAVTLEGAAPGDFEIVTDDCSGRSLASGESCEVALRFAPAQAGARAAELVLAGAIRRGPARVALAGTGTSPRAELDRPVLDFGPQPVDGPLAWGELAILNTGTATLAIERVVRIGEHPDDFEFAGRCSGTTLEPGESCTFRAAFAPRAAGPRSALVRIESDSPYGEPTTRLEGVGTWSGPSIDALPGRLDFGGQRVGRTSGARPVRLVNRSGEPLRIERLTSPDPDTGFSLASRSCAGATLEPGEECSVEVEFRPRQEGAARGTFEIVQSGPEPLAVELLGEGTAPRLELVTTRVEFGELRVGLRGASRRVEVRNGGTAPLTVERAAIRGGESAFDVVADGCSGREVAPGARCAVEVAFQPRVEGRTTARLELRSDAGGSPAAAELAGAGIVAGLGLEPGRLDFGAVVRGESAERPVTLANSGRARLHVSGLRVEGPDAAAFRVARIGCRLDEGLAAGERCVLDVVCAPGADGAVNATLIVEHDGPRGRGEVELYGLGAPPRAGFAASPARIDFSTQVVGERTEIQTVTVSNPGPGRLELVSVRLAGRDAGDFRLVPATCEGLEWLAPGGDCAIGVRFEPQAEGDREATLVIRHNAPGDSARIPLRGRGLL